MNTDKTGCVYEIRCLKNNKVYIGQTIDFKRRVWEHKYNLIHNQHKNSYLQKDFNTFGMNNFIFSIKKDGLYRQQRLELETYLIQQLGGIESNNVYNFQDNIHENLEMRQKVSENQKGKVIKPESILKMKVSLTGRKLSEEHKLHIKQSCARFFGNNNPAKRMEVRKKISEKVSGCKNGMYGKTHTTEARNKISESHKGQIPWNKGKNISIETRNKISNTLKGRTAYNKGMCKYNQQFIEQLRNEYMELKSYKKVQKLHPSICYDVVYCLIRYGKTNKNKV